MKIRNLYIGQLKEVVDIKYIRTDGILCDKEVTSMLLRNTVFEKSNRDETKVKDIIYGGVYHIKRPFDCIVGESYATNLQQHLILEKIDGYNKKSISKKKLLKYISK